MIIGIVGLPNSGKTTVFNSLTGGQAETAAYSSGRVELQQATVEVPDPRVDRLVELFEPRKTTRARVEYQDIAGLAKGIGEGGLEGELLGAIAQSDALLHVVRAFESDEVPHPEGSVDPWRDVALLDTELLLSDLVIVEGRIERLEERIARGKKGPERDDAVRERELLLRVREELEAERPVRDIELSAAERKRLRGFQLLTAKPMLVVLNQAEHATEPSSLDYDHARSTVLAISGLLEMELAQLPVEDRAELMDAYDIAEPGLHRVIRESYRLLGLQSFFTVGEDEVRAWTVPIGATAAEAAGAIHSDLERGFIRADVATYEDVVEYGSMAATRQAGRARVEGRDHVVADGEIVHVRFSV